MNEEQLENFLSTETPYHFTIHNECSDLASASINLESLTVSGKALEDEYIDAILYEDDYNANLNTNKKLNTPNDANKVISAAKHAYSLYTFTLKSNEEKDFNLLLYMDPDTPMVDANMNASWKGKITLSTEYQEENTTIRQISSSDKQGMWGYKEKLTQIVIENKKSVKTAEDGGKVYGPFDESANGYGGVQSYVVCDESDENCIGYLQGTNGIKGNEDSSNLFNGFTNVIKINGLENLNTSNVVNMSNMFAEMSNLQELDLSSFITKNVTNMSGMFSGVRSLQTLDLKNFNTSNVTNMDSMFGGASGFKNLDLSNFDTRKVTSINGIFAGAAGLTELNLSNWNLSGLTTSNGLLFGGNTLLETINMTNFVFPENCSGFFSAGLTNLNNLIFVNIDTSNSKNMNSMFSGCVGIKTLDLSNFDTTNVTVMNNMFQGTTSLQSITFGPKFIHNAEATTTGMFNGCRAPERPTGESWDDVSFE